LLRLASLKASGHFQAIDKEGVSVVNEASVNNNVSQNGVRDVVIAQIEQIAREQKKALHPLVDDLVLLDSGLDSLCLAILVARLDDTLGLDPFDNVDEKDFPLTLGDFVGLYENAGN
jgi:hypothetical protein